MTFIFSSFQDNVGLENRYSIVRWQPPGYHLEILPFFVSQISLERCQYSLEAYTKRLQRLFLRRRKAIDEWLGSLPPNSEISLLCRCPYSKVSEEQIQIFGKFMCHSVVVAKYLESLGYDVLLDQSRQTNAILIDGNYMPYAR